jgi:hypothetical protein
MIDPLYGGKSAHDVLQALLDNPQAAAYDVVLRMRRPTSRATLRPGWRKALHDGWVEGTAFTPKSAARGEGCSLGAPAAAGGPYEISFRPILRSTTAATPTTAGCRSCPSR